MAECPGMVRLAAMADGGLARLRAPGGALTVAQLRAVADAAERLGSGVVDLTNRANLQIRGLALDAGPALVAALEHTGFQFHGEADRRRNILLDPFAGLDPLEIRDLRPLALALDDALVTAPWIALLSPKFSFVLDGGGECRVGAAPSDVTVVAVEEGVALYVGGRLLGVFGERETLHALLALAAAAAAIGPDARSKDIPVETLGAIAKQDVRVAELYPLSPRYGAVATREVGRSALSLPAPVGRLDPVMLRFLACVAEADGNGEVRLAPWSAVVVPDVAAGRADAVLAAAETAGFTPVAVARRLEVAACSGAGCCDRAREPAKKLAAEVLALAARDFERLPEAPARLHLSACAKGCAGSTPADFLLLGDSVRDGWGLHRHGAPRRPGPELRRLDGPSAADILALLGDRD